MNPDLTRLIRLQQLETAADEARRRIADHPARTQALDARLQAARDAVAGVKARLAAAQPTSGGPKKRKSPACRRGSRNTRISCSR